MTTTFSLFGSDTITLNGKVIKNLCAGEVAKLTFPNEIGTVKTGKDGNSIYIKNESGHQAQMELRVIRGSSDDSDLNGYLSLFKDSPVTFVLLTAELAKPFGTGAVGSIAKTDRYTLEGGIPVKQVEAVVNLEGDSEQAISVYTFIFAKATRSIG